MEEWHVARKTVTKGNIGRVVMFMEVTVMLGI